MEITSTITSVVTLSISSLRALSPCTTSVTLWLPPLSGLVVVGIAAPPVVVVVDDCVETGALFVVLQGAKFVGYHFPLQHVQLMPVFGQI